MLIRQLRRMVFTLGLLAVSQSLYATKYTLPDTDTAVIGDIHYDSIGASDSLGALAQRYDVGFNSLESSNPQYNLGHHITNSTLLEIPDKHLLPNPHQGIVVNLPEMRMYYFPDDQSNVVYTYPIGIGKMGKTIPIQHAIITRKVKNPIWIPPDDIREFNLAQGIVLPKIMPARPDNPLGPYAVYMSIPTFLFHSTIFPESIGRRASFGCIRMYQNDIEEFFPAMKKGVPVAIVNSPVKVAWQKDRLYMEAHPPLEEHLSEPEASLSGMVSLAEQASGEKALVDWQLIAYLEKTRDGLPHEIGLRLP